MTVFILSFVVIGVCMLALGLSLIVGRGQIKGSCRATDELPGFDTGDGCSGACSSSDRPASDCAGRHHCRHQQAASEPARNYNRLR